ncbi:MAG: hypothetical protein R3D29_11675 [Nitratireductor sp.]
MWRTGGTVPLARASSIYGGKHSYPMHGDMLSEAGAETVIAKFADLPAVIDAFAAWDGFNL